MEVENIPSLHKAIQHAEVVIAQAKAIVIQDNDSYRFACEFQKTLYAADKEIEQEMAKPKTTTHEAHKAVCDLENKYRDPIKGARKINGGKIDQWENVQEGLRLKEELRVREESRQREEVKQLDVAEDLEKEGRHEEAEAELERPSGPAPVVQSNVPKVGGMRRRATMTYRILNAELVPREYCSPDPKKIGPVLRASGGTKKIPGVEVNSGGRTK